MGAAAVAVFSGCVLALSVARAKTPGRPWAPQLPASARLTAAEAPVPLPPNLEARLREKIRYMESDLRLEPKNEALLSRLARSYAALALTLREERRVQADKAINLAREMVRRRKEAYPNAPDDFEWVYEGLDRLAWAPAGTGMMLPQMMGVSGGAVMSPTPMMGASGGTPAMSPMPTMVPPGLPPLAGPSYPPGQPPASPRMPYFGNAPRPGAMGSSQMFQPMAGPPAGVDQERALRSTIASCLTKRRQNPSDLNNLDVLGATYQRMAELEQDPRKRRSNTHLKLALEVFRDAARRSRLRIHKASFLRAAGDVYSDLGDYPNQYRMAKLAAEQTPFSPTVWDELQNAALRVGRFADSRNAARKSRAWTLPIVQSPSPMRTGQLAMPSAP